MKSFLQRFRGLVLGILCGFDRLVFRGKLCPLYAPEAILYPTGPQDSQEKRRRSSRVTRLLRLLRGHGLLQKVPKTHRYQVSEKARTAIAALLAAGNAGLEELVTKAA